MGISSKSFSKGKPARDESALIASLRRLDIRFPWLKIVGTVLVGLIVVLHLLGVTISKTNDSMNRISVAPMAKHVRITERVLEGKKLVALTFDDGPSTETTPNLLDILKNRDVPVTFFMLGGMARSYPEVVKRAKEEGHEIASHTMYHQNLIRIPAAAAEADINEAKVVFKEILGQDVSLTRVPYGNVNDRVRGLIGAPIILWSVDTLDWKIKTTDSIVGITMSQVRDGAIILMHDIHPTSVEAVPRLIDTLRDAGYEFVTVSELAKIKGVNLASGAIYYNF